MKKLFLFFILILCFFLTLALPVRTFGFFEELFGDPEEKEFIIFSDPDFTQAIHNFRPGQKIYIRIETSGGGESQKLLRILDSAKKEVNRLDLNRSGNGPYVYTASLNAPAQSGIYYVDIKIEGGGSSFASQENINVGDLGDSASVSSEAESIVGGSRQTQENILKPTFFPSLAPTIALKENPPQMFFTRLLDFFQKIFFTNLTRWFR